MNSNIAILIDLDDTLISTTELNNDAYNNALEYFGFKRILKNNRITRSDLSFINENILQEIINLKQKYFSEKWMKYRVVPNTNLIKKLQTFDRENCYIWTSADEVRAKKLAKEFNFKNFTKDIIFDKKNNIENTKTLISNATKANNFIVYENDKSFLQGYCEELKIFQQDFFNVYKMKFYL